MRLLSGRDKNGDGVRRGSLSQTVSGISAEQGRWFRFRVRGLAQDGFHVQRDALFLKVEFFRDGGTNSLDHLQKSIYGQVAQERDDLHDKGNQRQPRLGKLAQLRPRIPHAVSRRSTPCA